MNNRQLKYVRAKQIVSQTYNDAALRIINDVELWAHYKLIAMNASRAALLYMDASDEHQLYS